MRVHPAVHCNHGDLLREMAIAGEAVILQPRFIVDQALRAGTLVPILEAHASLDIHLYAVYLSRQYLPSKVRVFIDFLVEELANGAGPARIKPSRARP